MGGPTTRHDRAGLRMVLLLAAWVAGMAATLGLAALPPAGATACLAAAGGAAAWWGWRRGRCGAPAAAGMHRAAAGVAWLGVAALGAAWALTLAQGRWADALAPALEGEEVVVTGRVIGLPRAVPDGVRFEFEPDTATWRGRPAVLPQRIALGWYRGWDGSALQWAPDDGVRAGQRWQFTVRLRQPHGPANPHGFDAELWLFERGLRATGHVRPAAAVAPRLLAAADGRWVDRARRQVRDRIEAAVADERAAGVLAALAVGDQASIDRADWEVFRATGTAHLMAISGLHVTMFAWAAGGAIGWAWRRSARASLWLAAPVAARWGGVAAAAGYAVFAGWAVPSQRTVWMLATAAALATAGAPWPWGLVLAASGAVVATLDPWALLQPGFWLSFAAVGLLLASEPAQRGKPADAQRLPWLRNALRTQWLASVALAPLTLLLFQQVSLVGFAANLVAVPLVTLAITPAALLGVAVPALWPAAAWLVQLLGSALAAATALPWAVWTAAVAPLWAQAAGLAAAALAVAPLPWRLRLLAVPMMLPLLWPAVPRPAAGAFELLVADVGQGTAVLVRTRHHLLVYDSGPAGAGGSDAGARVLVPLLRARGERRIDHLMISHRDADHAGGAASLFAALPVRSWSSSLEPGHALRGRAEPHRPCAAGLQWSWDGVQFEVLHPGDALLGAAAAQPGAVRTNALSCVLRVRGADGRSALLTGDIEAAQEAALVARHGASLRSDVLLVPHHGSRTSSTDAFLDAVAPRWAVVQAGYQNRFGHPAPAVTARLAARGIALARSDRCGAWWWDGNTASCQRQQRRRYWQAFRGPASNPGVHAAPQASARP